MRARRAPPGGASAGGAPRPTDGFAACPQAVEAAGSTDGASGGGAAMDDAEDIADDSDDVSEGEVEGDTDNDTGGGGAAAAAGGPDEAPARARKTPSRGAARQTACVETLRPRASH